MRTPTRLAATLLGIGLASLSAAAQPAPQTQGNLTPLQRFRALPPDRQEAIRNEIEPLFVQTLEANAGLLRMAQDCNMPLPQAATAEAVLERDLQSPEHTSGLLFGQARQGALLARFRETRQAPIDCGGAAGMRPQLIARLAGFGPAFQEVLMRSLAAGEAPGEAPEGRPGPDAPQPGAKPPGPDAAPPASGTKPPPAD
ncbi:hypothetical protein VQH23_12965 [Pararoseomonas sp. SCSIO 73927]|uniref:hypothetical protein n=1 Tax=Pararoseomonas sp. SCSIO 73927 TaxID=3114537 RepID=UPI0030CCEDAF